MAVADDPNNPKGLTFADLIAAADSCDARVETLAKLRETVDGEDQLEWIDSLIAGHRTDAERFRKLAAVFAEDK